MKINFKLCKTELWKYDRTVLRNIIEYRTEYQLYEIYIIHFYYKTLIGIFQI